MERVILQYINLKNINIMKKLHFFSLVAVFFILCGCSSKSGQIQYLPCKVDKGDDWGFVNAKGEVFCKDGFKSCPSVVRDGVFFVKEGETYSMYKFDAKKPSLLMEDILCYGRPRNGIVPVCRKDNHIEVLDVSGKVLFTLDDLDGQEVISCSTGYTTTGYLTVNTADDQGNLYCAVIDTKGNVILKPKYSSIQILSDNLFYVGTDSESKKIFVNKKGEKQDQWKELDLCSTMVDRASYGNFQYVCAKRDDRCYIYDLKGEEILKCSEKVHDILDISKDYFVFEGANGYGVMNLKGEKLLSDKYQKIQMLEGVEYLVLKDSEHKWEWLDKKGELKETLSSFEDGVAYIKEFGYIAGDNNIYYILNKKFERASKEELYDFEYPGITHIHSDYFDFSAVVNHVKNIIENGLKDKHITFSNEVVNIPSIIEQGVDRFNSYSRTAYVTLAQGSKYYINAGVDFDDKILKGIYKEKKVQEYSYWYGYYTTTKKELDRYVFNEEAMVVGIDIECNVPSEKSEQMNKELSKLLSSMAQETDKNKYYINGLVYELSETRISIDVE